ncbi:CP family cyanate transporter-like MFS transporter [Actinocrispum wychmicini]|uniref:CP family cyanate transporter-like MFS transporter n=1 Tax=Actinocrispum wychmicini TaxID=1213861 RepID=A0A4R2IVP4_9PSEU|nr:CP family cyanate transporter-like MFS transporter [Actinocrispum wychmicini]
MSRDTTISTAVVFALALNLRPAVTSLGAALEDVSVARNLTAAVLVALPLWAIGVGGWATPWLRQRWGTHRTVTVSLVGLALSLVVRVLGGVALLLSGTALACFSIAVLGTMLPLLARGSAGYTLGLGLGSTAGALVTPAVVTSSSWQVALGVWAFVALLAQQVWWRTRIEVLPPRAVPGKVKAGALTIHFGLISTVTFLVMGWFPGILRNAGVHPTTAGACLAVSMAMGLPMMWLVPAWTRKWRNQTLLVVTLAAPNVIGVTGLLVAPAAAPWLWACATGLGMGALAFALTTISLRSTDNSPTLSAVVQGVGYVIAGFSVLACGWLHTETGTWRAPLLLVLVILLGQVVSGHLAVSHVFGDQHRDRVRRQRLENVFHVPWVTHIVPRPQFHRFLQDPHQRAAGAEHNMLENPGPVGL